MRSGAAAEPLALGVLGPLQVSVAHQLVVVQGRRRRAVLARLLLSPNEVVSADRLIDDVWGEALPEEPANALQACISYLRTVLEPHRATRGAGSVLMTTKPGYTMLVSAESFDALRFEDLVRQGCAALGRGEAPRAVDLLGEAMGLWRGALLPEFASEPWVLTEEARLDDLRAIAVEERIEAELLLGRHTGVVTQLESAVRTWPFRERLYGQQMLALYRSGRQAESLQVFQSLRKRLGDELGIEPRNELRDLEEAILLQKPELDWRPLERQLRVNAMSAQGKPPVDRDAIRHNLPAPVTSFIGREWEMEALRGALSRTRLLTLVGTGGVGKTRLAVELALTALEDHPDGVYLIDLATLTNPAAIDSEVRSALGLSEEPGRGALDTVASHIGGQKMLLVLDNCEHVVDRCASVVQALLQGCSQLRLLITSRERLRVPGETSWLVPSLSFPEVGAAPSLTQLMRHDAVRLFVERAKAVRAGIEVSTDEVAAVAEICRRLDGIPLALELAAARANVLSVSQIATHLRERFGLLSVGWRVTPRRHETLRAAIDWSFNSLSDQERCLFARMSVFVGGMALNAVGRVCGMPGMEREEILDTLSQLVDKSFVAVDEQGGRCRYRLLETMRGYGAEKLVEWNEQTDLANRHLAWAVSLTEAAEGELNGPSQQKWLAVLEVEHANLQGALEWADDPCRAELGLRQAAALGFFWQMRGFVAEGRHWIERLLLAYQDGNTALRAKALNVAATLAFYQGDPHGMVGHARQALAIGRELGDHRETGRALASLGSAAGVRSEFERACTLYAESLVYSTRANDRPSMGVALVNLGFYATRGGDVVAGREWLEKALRLRQDIGDEVCIGRTLAFLGVNADVQGDLDEARALFEESLTIARRLNDHPGMSRAIIWFAASRAASGDHELVRALLREGISLALLTGHRPWIMQQLFMLADEAIAAGHVARGTRLLGAAVQLQDTLAGAAPWGLPRDAEPSLMTARSRLGDKRFEAMLIEGRSMSLDEVMLSVQQDG